jgi:c-di-GMP-binding flagellar brake protein YcgR
MFTTRNLGSTQTATADRRPVTALRLAMPDSVERCQRRNHYRVETAELSLPQVEVWPLLDPKSVLLAERASELQLEAGSLTDDDADTDESDAPQTLLMPEVGPKFTATMLNLGGGGIGLRVLAPEAQSLSRHKVYWMHIHLPSAPSSLICATGKLVHTHMESTHDLYAGMAFDFTFNPAHERFVIDQICRYIALQQGAQLHSLRLAG